MIDKSTYFYSDEESLQPVCAWWVWVLNCTSVWHPFYLLGAKMSIVLQRVIMMMCKYRITNSYYCPVHSILVRHDVCFKWCSDIWLDIELSVHGVSLYFWCLGCFLFRLLFLGPYWMEVSTWKEWIHTFMIEKLLVFLCVSLKENLFLHFSFSK